MSNPDRARVRTGRPGMTPLQFLTARWREDAACLRRYGDERGAHLVNTLAQQLEEALAAEANEPLTRRAAAALAGCHPDSLTRRVRRGRLQNVGSKNAPRYRRGDVARTGAVGLSHSGTRVQLVGTTREQIARSVVEKGRDDG